MMSEWEIVGAGLARLVGQGSVALAVMVWFAYQQLSSQSPPITDNTKATDITDLCAHN